MFSNVNETCAFIGQVSSGENDDCSAYSSLQPSFSAVPGGNGMATAHVNRPALTFLSLNSNHTFAIVM